MNVGRGLFRGWIFVTVLWLIGAGTLAYSIIGNEVSHWKWQYEHQSRTNSPPWEIDWSLPYYEIMRSPSAEKLAVIFNEVGYQYVRDWDQSVKDRKLNVIEMPDHSSVVLEYVPHRTGPRISLCGILGSALVEVRELCKVLGSDLPGATDCSAHFWLGGLMGV